MSSPPTINCRSISLLKLTGASPSRPEQEGCLHVSVHQLSLHLLELFKAPRGSIQKKIRDLGITLSNCSKESVLLLRDQCVIGSHKASQLTLQEAEKVFDAIQRSWERRTRSVKKKQELAERRWLKKVGTKNKITDNGSKKGQRHYGVPLERDEGEMLLSTMSTPEGQRVGGCGLYGNHSPPTSKNQSRSRREVEDDQLEKYRCINKVDPLVAVDSQWEQVVKPKDQLSLGANYSHSSCMDKSNGYPTPLLQMEGYSTFSAMVEGKGTKSLSPPSNYVHMNDRESTPHQDTTDEEEEERLLRADLAKKQQLKKQKLSSDVSVVNSLPALHKRLVVTKLRHFAKTTSPTTSKNSIAPSPSIGKHLPLSPLSTPAENSDFTCPESLIVSIPRVDLAQTFDSNICSSFYRRKSTRIREAQSDPSKALRQRLRFRGSKVKPKATALYTFVSKKRAATPDSSPAKYLKISTNGLSQDILMSQTYSSLPKPGHGLSGKVIHTPSSPLSKSQVSSESPESPLSSEYPLPAGNGLVEENDDRYTQFTSPSQLSPTSKLFPTSQLSPSSSLSPLANGHENVKNTRDNFKEIKKPPLTSKAREVPLEQGISGLLAEDDCMSVTSSSSGSMTRSINGKAVTRELALEQTTPIGYHTSNLASSRLLVEDDCISIASSSSSMMAMNNSPLPSSTKNEILSVPSTLTNPFHSHTRTSVITRSSTINQPGCGSGTFNFTKLFDSLPPKLVVRNGELCPEQSLSLKGSKLFEVPSTHPIWTWRLGQPTKQTNTSFKVRNSRRHKQPPT